MFNTLLARAAIIAAPLLCCLAPLASAAPARLSSTAPGSVAVLIGASAMPVGFYNEGLDFEDHETADARELARHEENPMSPNEISTDLRRRLQAEVTTQEETEARRGFRSVLRADVQMVPVPNGDAFKAVFAKSVSHWVGTGEASEIQPLFTSSPTRPVILVYVEEVSHGTGLFLVHKASAHYFCVDSAAQARIALPDGRLLKVHSARICQNSLFHPWHSEVFQEVSERQAMSLHRTFERLARDVASDLRRSEPNQSKR